MDGIQFWNIILLGKIGHVDIGRLCCGGRLQRQEVHSSKPIHHIQPFLFIFQMLQNIPKRTKSFIILPYLSSVVTLIH